MGRKVVILSMIAVLLAGTIMPVRTYAVWGVIGSTVVKESIKHVTKSQMVRSGIKASSKSALERAHEAWFSRFTAQQVAAIEQAAARAVPADTPGWVKVAVGVSLWATGLDLALELWDAIQGGEEVIFPSQDTTYGKVVGYGGFGLILEPYHDEDYPKLSTYYVRIAAPFGTFASGFDNYISNPNQINGPNHEQNRLAIRPGEHNLNDYDMYIEENVSYLIFNIDFNNVYPYRPFRSNFRTHLKKDLIADLVPNYEQIKDVPMIASNMPGVTYIPTTVPAYVPNPHPDLFPSDSQAVEILVPDPSVWPNPDEAIWQNMDYIRQDVSDPITDPKPESPDSPDWSDPTPPSAPDWASRLHGVVSTRFPFSLPWDLYRILSVFAAEPERPHIRVDENYMGMPFRFEVDFSFLDPYMPFFRGFIIVGFCVGLVLITRRIMGGGT